MGTTFELEEATPRPTIGDDEMFTAELVACKVVEKENFDKTEKFKKVQFRFVIEDPGGDFDGTAITGETGTAFNTHENCKLRNWANALLNKDLQKGDRLDIDQLVGNRAKIIVGRRDYKKDGEDRVWNFVKDVLPAGGYSFENNPF